MRAVGVGEAGMEEGDAQIQNDSYSAPLPPTHTRRLPLARLYYGGLRWATKTRL